MWNWYKTHCYDRNLYELLVGKDLCSYELKYLKECTTILYHNLVYYNRKDYITSTNNWSFPVFTNELAADLIYVPS